MKDISNAHIESYNFQMSPSTSVTIPTHSWFCILSYISAGVISHTMFGLISIKTDATLYLRDGVSSDPNYNFSSYIAIAYNNDFTKIVVTNTHQNNYFKLRIFSDNTTAR